MSSTSFLPNERLKNRVAIITGSTEGIGYAIAERFAQEGAKIVICSRREENVSRAVRTLKSKNYDVVGCVCHVSKEVDRKHLWELAIKTYGHIDILVSNVAVNPSVNSSILNCTESVWDKVFDVNLKAGFLLTKEALPYLKQSPYGRVIFISTIGAYVLTKSVGCYGVSKTALLALTKAIAVELAAEKITVNCIAPGLIPTKFSHAYIKPIDEVDLDIAMKRFGKVEEISGVAAYIASDDASYLTGETIAVSGGIHTRL